MKPPPAATDPPAEALRARLTSVPWRVVHTGCGAADWNMALDAALLHHAAREEAPPTLRFYGWAPPAVSLGRFQSLEGIDAGFAVARGWDLVRRPTGGRAVLHQWELTYSLVLPPSMVAGAGIRTSYAVLTEGLNTGLRLLLTADVAAPAPPGACATGPNRPANCFALAGECDTLVADGKLVGSAQVREGGALLQHGSILLDAEPEAWAALFGSPGRLVTLRQLLGEAPAVEVVATAVMGGFAGMGVRFEESAVTPAEERTACAGPSRYRVMDAAVARAPGAPEVSR